MFYFCQHTEEISSHYIRGLCCEKCERKFVKQEDYDTKQKPGSIQRNKKYKKR